MVRKDVYNRQTGLQRRCLLISPNHMPYLSRDNMSRLSIGRYTIPLDLGYIGTQLDLKGDRVKLLFANRYNMPLTKVEKEIDEYLPDFIGISSSHGYICPAPSIKPTIDIINLVRYKSPKIRAIVFGGLATMFEDTLLRNGADVVIRKEPELKFIEVIDNIQNVERINGIGYRENDNIFHNEDDSHMVDLDLLPPINYNLFTPDHLNIEMNPMTFDYTLPSKKIITLETNRGCPYRCAFCYQSLRGHMVRHKSIEKVIDEIKYYMSQFGTNVFQIPDNIFTISRSYVINLCERINKLPFKIYWRAVTRPDFLDLELLKIMKAAGCYNLSLGLETADNEILKRIKKQYRAEDVENAVMMCKSVGITVALFSLFFLPGETLASIERTLKFATRLRPLWIGANIATPIPKTGLYEMGLEEGKLKGESSRLLEECIEVAGTIGNNFTRDEVKSLYRKIRRRLFLINITSNPLNTVQYIIKTAPNIGQFRSFFTDNVKYFVGG